MSYVETSNFLYIITSHLVLIKKRQKKQKNVEHDKCKITGIRPPSDHERCQYHSAKSGLPCHPADTGHLCPDAGKDITQSRNTMQSTEFRYEPTLCRADRKTPVI